MRMREAGSSVGSCAINNSQWPAAFMPAFIASYTAHFATETVHGFQQGTRRPRPQLPAADPAHQESPRRHAVRAGAESPRDGSWLGEGFSELFQADRPRAGVA